MNSVRLTGLIAPRNSYLVIGGLFITSRFALTWFGCFMPTRVERTDCAGTERIS